MNHQPKADHNLLTAFLHALKECGLYLPASLSQQPGTTLIVDLQSNMLTTPHKCSQRLAQSQTNNNTATFNTMLVDILNTQLKVVFSLQAKLS